MKTESNGRNHCLESLGLNNLGNVHWDLPTPAHYEGAIRR